MLKLRILLGLLLTMVALPSLAAPWRASPLVRDGQRAMPHRFPPQDFRRDVPQRPVRRDLDNPDDSRRAQRLSPEERRQLRRDVHDAGRDVYPARRRERR